MSAGDSIGMMEGAFFVSRTEVLDWLNELLQLQLTKVEQCATGSVYCQVIDAIYPGSFPLSKVKWDAKHEHEFVNNFKVLQQAFSKNGIQRHIEVGKLVKAKYQDNLEFCQWIKRYFDINYNGEPYDAVERRKGKDLYYIGIGNKPQPVGGPKGSAAAAKKPSYKASAPSAHSGSGTKKTTTGSAISGGAGAASSGKVSELTNELQELKFTADTLEKERDFYFGKLRDIEILLQAKGEEGNPIIQEVMKILYATEDEKVEIDENGELQIHGGEGAEPAAAGEEPQVDME